MADDGFRGAAKQTNKSKKFFVFSLVSPYFYPTAQMAQA
jgi:hypothetical protein